MEQFETRRSFGDNIYTSKINIDKAEIDQSNLLEKIVKYNNKSRPRSKEIKKRYLWKCICSWWNLIISC